MTCPDSFDYTNLSPFGGHLPSVLISKYAFLHKMGLTKVIELGVGE